METIVTDDKGEAFIETTSSWKLYCAAQQHRKDMNYHLVQSFVDVEANKIVTVDV